MTTSTNPSDADDVHRQGSGLAMFFKDFLPSRRTRSGEEVDYCTSLSHIQEPTEDDIAAFEESVGVTFTPEEYDFKGWRDLQKEVLTAYLQKRMCPPPPEDIDVEDGVGSEEQSSDNDTDSEQEKGHDGNAFHASQDAFPETQPESQPVMETQEQESRHSESEAGNGSARTRRKRRRERKLIPNVNDAIHDVSKLEYLDLYTQTLNLPLCRVINVWRVRETKRAASHPLARPQPCPYLEGRLSRFPFECKEEDGPIASIFKHVFSIEVVQLNLHQADGKVSHKQLQSPRNMRLRVFFYNEYGISIYKWMQRQRRRNRKNEFIIGFSNVPAKCIFPFAIDSRNWMDQADLTEYCLCIGDQSFLKLMVDGKLQHTRFDTDDFELRILATDAGGLAHSDEMIWSSRRCMTEVVLNQTDPIPHDEKSPLQQAWKIFNEQRVDVEFDRVRETLNKDGDVSRRADTMAISEQQPCDATETDQTTNTIEVQGLPEGNSDPSTGGRHNEPQEQLESTGRSEKALDGPLEPMVFVGVANRRSSSTCTIYVKMGNLQGVVNAQKENGKDTINLYAAVLGFTSPRQTKRGDWMMSAVMVDESCTTPVTAVMFCKQANHLPKLAYMGDVIRIHRAGLEEWKGAVQVFGNKNASSYAVVRNSESGWKVYPTATSSFSFTQSDEQRSQTLWRWAQCWVKENATIKPEHCFTLSEIPNVSEEDEDLLKDRDITVMITGKYPYPDIPNGFSPKGFLRVWDGTGFFPSDPPPVETIVTQNARGWGDPPPAAVSKVASIAQGLQTTNYSMKLPKALCGKVSNVVIWEDPHWALVTEHAPVGTFLRLRNIDVRRWQQNQFRSLIVHPQSWLTVLPETNYEVLAIVAQHNIRVLRNEYNPASGLLPTINLGDGLSSFVNRGNHGSYTGVVRVLKPVPEIFSRKQLRQKLSILDESDPGYPTGMVIADLSGSTAVLVSGDARARILELLPASDESTTSFWSRERLFGSKLHCRATIHSVILNDERYLVMTNLSSL